MTYLELVNNVLRRLRETEVTTVQSTAYSKLIGDIVNDAKRLVEDAWDWSMQRNSITTTLLPLNNISSGNYISLVGSGESPKIESIIVGWEDPVFADVGGTGKAFLTYIDQYTMEEKIRMEQPLLGDPVPTGRPTYYSFYGIDSNRDSRIRIYPSPDQSYLLLTSFFRGQTDLSADGDVLIVPYMPVIHLAVALAARERGETGGTSTQEYFQIANKYLSDALAMDAGKHPEQTIFYTV